ncbi:MAG: hypothetical protein K9N55_09930 [Phycisphaerae bacterium]|nr:hypothetical protein [Phycisphaerae bacterium]
MGSRPMTIAVLWAVVSSTFLCPALSAVPVTEPLAEASSAPENRRTGGQPDTFIYKTSDGISFHVTTEGLSSIRIGQRELASGGWSVFNAEHWFKESGSGLVKTAPVASKSLEVLAANLVRVRHAGGDVACVVDYTFDGEDVTISSRIENHHASEPINVVGFSGLVFHFDRPPEGLMQVQHISYFQAHGLGLCHPSFWSKIGGSYAADDSIGVGVSPWKIGWTRSLILWDYSSWAADQRENSPDRRLMYFAGTPVPARGAATIDLRVRVSSNRLWKHLLAPYREHFQATFGAVQYQADDRWIASDYMNHSQQAVSSTNPYGFHGGHRRIDLGEGVESFCRTLIPRLKSTGGQGVILWGQGGDDPRGAMYRPDFDVLPPEVALHWPLLVQRFREAGLKLGVTTRPADLAVRRDWRSDEVIQLNADDPGHLDMLWQRFQNMINRGCTLFYLDSFGADLEHVKLMRDLRERMGPKILTFAEHQCDAMLPFSGGYSETTFSANGKNGPQYRLWSGMDNWEIYQWLVPGAQLIARLYEIEGDMPPGFEVVDRYYYRNRITPLVPVSDFRRLDNIEQTQPEFISDEGKWK